MQTVPKASTQSEQVGHLIIAATLAVFLPQLPFGQLIFYPFVLLTTWFHEMGHGIAATLMGWDFERLLLLSNGSGIAESYPDADAGRIEQAIVGAGGPLGPSMAGAVLIIATRWREAWRPTLFALAGLIVLSVVVYVRSLAGWIALPLIALGLAAIAMRGSPAWQRFSLQFVGMVAALSMFSDWHYLFSYSGIIDGRPLLSDTGQIQQALALPYWFWAGVIVIVSVLMVGAALKFALAEDGAGAPARLRSP